jgi:hypothetical protein
MQKITLFFLAAMTAFIVSCSKTEEVKPPTVIGKWTLSGLGSILDTKTYDATIDEIRKNPNVTAQQADGLAKITFEFKEDKTYLSNYNGNGTYVVAQDGKSIALTSEKSTAAKPVIETLEIVTLTQNELKLGLKKLVKPTGESEFKLGFEDLAFYIFGIYGFAAKGGTTAELEKARSIQGTLNLKR